MCDTTPWSCWIGSQRKKDKHGSSERCPPGRPTAQVDVKRAAAEGHGTVVIFIHNLGSGGAQRVVSWLADTLSVRGHEVTIVTVAQEGSPHFPLSGSVRRLDLGESRRISDETSFGGRIGGFVRRWNAVRKVLRTRNVNTVVSFVGPMNVLVLLASRGLSCRVVVSERNDPARQRLPGPWDWLRRRCYKWADMVTVNTEGGMGVLAEFVPRSRLRLVRNAAPSVRLENVGETADRKSLLSVGRLHYQKGFDVLLRAYAQLEADLRRDWCLRVVGSGDQKSALRALAAGLGITENVKWMGEVADPLPYYGEAGIFVLASRYEGFPNALLEAMACGCACIVTDASPGPLELIEDGATGLVVPVGDAAVLSRRLMQLMLDPSLRRRLAESGRQRVMELDPGTIGDVWEEVLWPDSSQVVGKTAGSFVGPG